MKEVVRCSGRSATRILCFVQFLLLFLGFAAKAQAQDFCDQTLSAPCVNIHVIQTGIPNSRYMGQTVQTVGIVVAILSDGFYIENSQNHPTCTDAPILNCWDNDVTTSEGIFVDTTTKPDPSYAGIGNMVRVVGKVAPSNSSADPNARGTELQPGSSGITYMANSQRVPDPVAADILASARTGIFGQWLEFEGMRINIPSLITTSATGGTLTASSQTATQNGLFWGVLAESTGATARTFRGTGISALEPVPASAPATVARWSGNPSLLFVDSSLAVGANPQPPLNVTANSTVKNLTGVVDYHESALGYTGLLLDNFPPYYYGYGQGAVTAGPGANGTPVPAPVGDQVTIASENLDNFYDSSTFTQTAFSTRVAKTALAIVNFEKSPDVIGVQQVQSMAAMQALVSQISADGGPSYTPCWFSGNDSTGLTNGFLINEARVTLVSCDQLDASNTYQAPDGSSATLFDRPPLAAVIGLKRGGPSDYQITIVNSELLDRTEIYDPTNGATVRARRAAQAEELSNIIQGYQSAGDHVVAVGGYNSFEFSDGFVDTMGAIVGNPTAANLVTLSAPSNTSPAMVNLTTVSANTPENRYTFVENGSAEETDHVLVSSELAPMATVSYARFGADFPLTDLNDGTTALHASSHDGVVGYLAIPYVTNFTLTSSLNPSVFNQNVTFTATATGIAGTATGTVTFSDGGTVLCNAQPMSGGTATCSTSTLTIGTHTIKADYSGDTSYEPASATLAQTVTPPDFSLSISPGSKTVYTGEPADFTLLVTPGPEFTYNIDLTCSGAPPGTTCTITPNPMGPQGSAKLVLQTQAPVNTKAALTKQDGRRALPLLAGLLLIFVPKRFRRGRRWLLAVLLTVGLTSGLMSACTSSGTLTGGTTPGTYTITVSGNAVNSPAPVLRTVTATLKVKSLF